MFVTRIEYLITSPAASTRNGGVVSPSTPVTVFSIVNAGLCASGTAAESVTGSVWALSAVAVLSMSPSPPPLLSMSAWVTVYVPVQVSVAAGASVKPVVWLPAVPGSQSRFAIRGSAPTPRSASDCPCS